MSVSEGGEDCECERRGQQNRKGTRCTAGQANSQERQEGTNKFTQRQVEGKLPPYNTLL